MARRISCGVLVVCEDRVLLGHATRSPRWDIPKGLAEADEALVEAAVRELREETGINIAPDVLRPLGVHAYLRDKDLALFLWRPAAMPALETLACASTFTLNGAQLPELDRFGVFGWEEALGKVGKNLARVLTEVRDSLQMR
jgi:8-oxo-dGTP pyrophosphatase MutT (NUDIX family)